MMMGFCILVPIELEEEEKEELDALTESIREEENNGHPVPISDLLTPTNPLTPTPNTHDAEVSNQNDKYNETIHTYSPSSILIESDREENEVIPNLVKAKEGAAKKKYIQQYQHN